MRKCYCWKCFRKWEPVDVLAKPRPEMTPYLTPACSHCGCQVMRVFSETYSEASENESDEKLY